MVVSTLPSSAPSAPTERALARNGAEAILQLLVACGVEYAFWNPGTDTAPLQEALVSLEQAGQPIPTLVPCLYENVALAGAHGYFQVTRRPQLVVVHVDVGTQNLGGNVHNAQRGQGGAVILAGRAPYTFEGTTPGGRDRPIQWQQDEPDQIGIVRNYVKWSQELCRVDTLHHVIPRAVQMAGSEPAGPVYMTAAREVLMQPIDAQSVELGPARRMHTAITPAGDPAALDRLASWLVEAERPLAIVGSLGRHPEAVEPLVELAEFLGMPVVDTRGPVNFPSEHPLFRSSTGKLLPEADVVLLLDTDVPWIPRLTGPSPTARVAQLDIDPLKSTIQVWGFPVDLPIQADTSKALPALLVEVKAQADRVAGARQRFAERRERHTEQRAALDCEAAAALEQFGNQRPIAPEWIGATLADRLPPGGIVVDEAVTSSDASRRFLRRQEPGTLLSSGAPGLGWGLGAAMGAKLAAPGREVAALVGDGSFVFGSPVAALWAAHQARAPFLTLVYNNGGYNASKNPVVQLFPHGASTRADSFPGVRFTNPPDYAALARSCHAYGERVEDPENLGPAIDRGVQAVRNGQAAVLDVVMAPI
jgi:acetolactate synthase I/II/III large subunit